jgi:hypothetical protein
MSLEKQWKMVQLLYAKTMDDEVDWREGAAPDTFQVSANRYSLTLRQTPAQATPDEFDYIVTLLNENGDVADQFADGDLYQEFKETIKDQSQMPYRVLGRLYELARRRALGTDRILDAILSDLGDIPF